MLKNYWLINHPSNYQIYLLNNLSENPTFDLKVYFLRKNSREHPWKEINEIKFNYKFFQFNNGFDSGFLKEILFNKNSLFVLANWSHPFAIFILNVLALLKRNYIIWTDTPNTERQRGLIKRTLRNFWLKYIISKSTCLMGTGEVALKVFGKMQFDKNKFINFPCFIDLKKFNRVNQILFDYKKNHLILFSSGRLDNIQKGYDVALKAIKIFKNKTAFNNFTYKIAGEGPDKEKLKNLAKQLKIEQNVEFLGWLDENELIVTYRASHIFLHPSRFDAWGVAIVEAMACGLTVIGSDKTGAVIDRVQDYKNGLIHKDNDENDLADKLIYLLENPGKISEFGYEARKASEQWDIQKAHEIIEHITQQLI